MPPDARKTATLPDGAVLMQCAAVRFLTVAVLMQCAAVRSLTVAVDAVCGCPLPHATAAVVK